MKVRFRLRHSGGQSNGIIRLGKLPKMDINRNAAAIALAEAFILAPLDLVWSVHTILVNGADGIPKFSTLIYVYRWLPEPNSVGNQVELRD